MYAIFGVINVKPEHVPAFTEATIREARGTVRDEPGVFQFHILTDADTPNRFYFFEIFRDEAAAEAHWETENFRPGGPRLRHAGPETSGSAHADDVSQRSRAGETKGRAVGLVGMSGLARESSQTNSWYGRCAATVRSRWSLVRSSPPSATRRDRTADRSPNRGTAPVASLTRPPLIR